ncbi:excalibur calcium-binding domain-containing protein [Pseudarthrobacter phenanthrenivorans]|uniref:excalibur calcium-binding domain-containing protein n=1 Tax=Pseudarthrobacter phenanthrenivorans TaxID=361575 RepID=UPI00344E423D
MNESTIPATGRMKASLALIVLAGLMLTGCGGKQAATQATPAAAATATAVAQTTENITVPAVVNLTLDKATDQLEKLGFKVDATDTAHGKSIMVKSHWQVTTQDPGSGAQAAKGSTVHLGVKNLDDVAAEKAAADKAAAEKAAAEQAAAAAKAAADKAAADKAAADQAAAAKAAADQAAAAAAQKAAKAPAPAPVAVPAAPAPAPAAYYANCSAAKAAGAAPLYRGQPGYSSALDRDGDGVACER